MKSIKILLWILVLVLCYAAISWLTAKQREKKALVDKTGIETIGIVVKKAYGKNLDDSGMINYSVSFDFFHEGKCYTRYGFAITEGEYDGVVIGRKYKVKFLPEAPAKTAQIYLDEPIYSEDINIEKEKERILETYK